MRYLHILFLLLCYVFCPVLAQAKEKPGSAADHKAMMEAYQKLATPSEPHKLFATLAGSWTTKTKEWMEPNKPPVESTGTVEMKMLMDGRYLQQDWIGQMMGQPYTGLGITGYDNMRKRYVSIWLDTMSTGMFMMEGTANSNGKIITLRGDHSEPNGGTMSHRAIWKIVDEKNQTFEMWGAHGGKKEMKMMEIVYTRK